MINLSAMDTSKFGIHGNGIVLKYFHADTELYKAFSNFDPDTIHQILTGDTFGQFGFVSQNGTLASTYLELVPSAELVAYAIDRVTKLEVKMSGRKRINIPFNSLLSDDFLFPLFNIHEIQLLDDFGPGLLLVEQDMGNFGKCLFPATKFDVDSLSFLVGKLPNLNTMFVFQVSYAGLPLLFEKRDTVTTGSLRVVLL